MDKDPNAVKITPAAAPVEEPAIAPTEDLEAKVASLEAERARLVEETSNWKLAALKAKGKVKEEPVISGDENNVDVLRRIAREELANSRLAEINREQEAINKKALKENKELKLALANRTSVTPSATIGTHNEGKPVTDTLVTPEQIAAFKARGWTDKDIERYKKNYTKLSGGMGR